MAMFMRTSSTGDGGMMASFISSFPDVEEIGEIDDDEERERSPSDDETVANIKPQAASQGPPPNENFDMPEGLHIKTVEKIPDVEKRIAEYEPWRKDIIRKAQEKRKQFNTYLASSDWKEIDSNPAENHAIYLMDTTNGRQAVKGVIEMNAKPMDIFLMITHPKARKTYDAIYDDGGMKMKIGVNTYLLYNKMKKVSVVASRDFCLVLHTVHEDSGLMQAVSFSIEHEAIPEMKGNVRAELFVS